MFDGETIERRDTIRLWSQLRAVKDLMLNNRDRWYSLEMIRSRLWYRYHLKLRRLLFQLGCETCARTISGPFGWRAGDWATCTATAYCRPFPKNNWRFCEAEHCNTGPVPKS